MSASSARRPRSQAASAARPRRRGRWDITTGLLYHLTFTSELVTLRQEMMLQETCGVSLTEWRILAVIHSFARISSKDITRVTSMNKAGVSRGVARLEAQGLVERTVDDADTRIHWLRLSDAGKASFAAVRRTVESWSAPLLSALAPDEIDVLKGYLMRLRARLGEITGEDRARNDRFIFRDA